MVGVNTLAVSLLRYSVAFADYHYIVLCEIERMLTLMNVNSDLQTTFYLTPKEGRKELLSVEDCVDQTIIVLKDQAILVLNMLVDVKKGS